MLFVQHPVTGAPVAETFEYGSRHWREYRRIFCSFAAKRVQDRYVHTFEPLSRLARVARSNFHENVFVNAQVHEVGLSDRSAEVPWCAFLMAGSDGGFNNGMSSFFGGAGCELVDSISLDTMDYWCLSRRIQRLDFLKIDVEGAELSVLKGGEDTIRRFKPSMAIEVNPVTCERAGYSIEDLLAQVGSLGYGIFNIGRDEQTMPLGATQSASRDVLCVWN